MADSDDPFNVFDFTNGNDPIDQNLIDLFNAAKADATTEELASEASTVTAMLAAMQAGSSNVVPFRSSTMRQRFITSKAATKAAIISGVVLFSATAAAAGGVLPHAVQSTVSRAVEHVGIHVENPDKAAHDALEATGSTSSTIDDKSVTSSTEDAKHSSSDDAVGPDAAGAAKAGLCKSFFEHQNNPAKAEDSVAAKNLADAAAKAGQTVATFCATAATTASSIDDHASNGNGNGADDTSSSVAGNSNTSGKGGSGSGTSGGNHSGVDDTTQSTTPTVSVPGRVDPAVTTSSVEDISGKNKP